MYYWLSECMHCCLTLSIYYVCIETYSRCTYIHTCMHAYCVYVYAAAYM